MHHYRIAVCEDETGILTYISQKVEQSFTQKGTAVQVDAYGNSQTLLAAITENNAYDIYYLDIDMPSLNGIELCRKIRLRYPAALVLFVSNKEELVFQTFAVQPFRFLRKSHFDEELPQATKDVLCALSERRDAVVRIRELHSSAVYSFSLKQLYYIESLGKMCRFVTPAGETMIQSCLQVMEDQLNPMGFVRCHRSYMVNCRHVFSIQKNFVVLDNKQSIPLSRSRVELVRTAFLHFEQKDEI